MSGNRFDVSHGVFYGEPKVEVTVSEPGFGEHLTAYLDIDEARLFGLEMIRKADLAEAEDERARREED